MATNVTLRRKKITKGRESLYLDFYPAITNTNGKTTRREFLKLRIYTKPNNPFDKKHNEETLRIAKAIRQKRENELNKPEIYTEYEKEVLRKKELGELNFVEYLEKIKNKKTGSNLSAWQSAYNYLNNFTGGTLLFQDINEAWAEDFKEYLLNTKSLRRTRSNLSQNSASSYFNKIKAALRQAFRDGILQTDINGKIPSIKAEETRREFLTIEELNQLVTTDCDDPVLKRAALFSALTGLRWSDIEKMKWAEVEHIANKGYILKYSQKKTKGIENLPISDQAVELMGEPQHKENKVFEGLKYSAYSNKHLAKWIGAAGITKPITFHSFRHTFATLQLLNGTDIYTVSKMLGHKELKTTQVYAKIVDQTKREAANKIKLDLP